MEAGQLLVRLDDRERRLEAREAEAEWLKIRAQYAVSYEADPPRTFERAEAAATEAEPAEPGGPDELLAEGLISRQARSSPASSGEGLPSERPQATGGSRRFHRSRPGGRTPRPGPSGAGADRIRAPFAGRVADLAVEPGQQLAPGEPLLTLLDDSRLEVDVDVLEADVVHLREGAPGTGPDPCAGRPELDGAVSPSTRGSTRRPAPAV